MYGGYGNAWSQQASAWATANANLQTQAAAGAGSGNAPGQVGQAQFQSQPSVFTTNTTQQAYQQQPNYMTYGGSMGNLSNPATVGMMAYMNMGASNPYMNYGAAANTGFGMNSAASTTTTVASSWLGNQHYQAQFPGGRPPLPPGPPPPDKPKDNPAAASRPNQNQAANQPPLPPTPNVPYNYQFQQQQQQQLQQRAFQPPLPPPEQKQPNNISSLNLNALKPEDALNIIKSAAALGMIPNNGSLSNLTSLNVSEELFGSKNASSGIPGLDITEDEKNENKTSLEEVPEVVDLEKDSSDSKGGKGSSSESTTQSSTGLKSNSEKKAEPEKSTALKTDSNQSQSGNPSGKAESQKKEVVWELRPDGRQEEAKNKNNSNPWVDQKESSGWKSELPTASIGSSKPVNNNQGTGANSGLTSSNGNVPKSENSNDTKPKGPPVRIPLEPADGKELVYDKKTLKQFDQKFREWENDFEKWKKANENHPDQRMYKQYLGQWNLWREQLVEQRRSILDTMTKAKLDSTEHLMNKMMEDVFYADDFSNDKFSETESIGAASNSSQQKNKPTFNMGEGHLMKGSQQPNNQNQFENPFSAAMKTASSSGPEPVKRTPPAAPNLSNFGGAFNVNQGFGAPVVNDKRLLPDSKNEGDDRERPVEKILRDSGGSGKGNSYNIFDKNFNSERPEKNLFDINSSLSSCGRSNVNQTKSNSKDDASKSEVDEVRIPFEWSLPSQGARRDNNPFDLPRQNENPFMQPSGPNPFDVKPEQRLPSLDDFIKRTNLDFTTPVSISTFDQRAQSSSSNNPFMWSTSTTTASSTANTAVTSSEKKIERIPRDPMEMKQAQPQPSPQSTSKPINIRLEANPVGMPLLIAAKEDPPPPKNEFDEFSQLFSRDRGPAPDDGNDNSNIQVGDDDLVFGDDTEVIDFGAGNSMDDLDFPKGENPNEKKDTEDDDFTLEDSEVIDYSQGIPPEELANFSGSENYGEGYDYPPEYEQGYPPGYFGPMPRGRAARGFPPPWARGHPRGFHPGHPFYGRGMAGPRGPPFHPEFGPMPFRGRPYGRGMFMRGGMPPPGFGPPPHPDWYQHDERECLPPPGPELPAEPEVVVLSPSPSPEPYGPKPPPNIKIAPPNPDFDREGGRRRSRSRSRSRERPVRRRNSRSRSRSRDRVSRRGRDRSLSSERRDRDRRRDDDRSRDRRSPTRLGRYDDRERGRDANKDRERDRFSRDRRGRSKSRSRSKSPPAREWDKTIVRNPLFPSASASSASLGMLGSYPAPAPPRYQTLLIEDILNKPGRFRRPPRIAIFMRGLPGSGKSHIVKLIKEREVEMGGKAPRILSIDNYFTTEIEKKEKDPVTGQEEKKTVMDYEYDEEREPLYRAQLVRQFKKTLDEGYFSFVIVDCVNEYVRQFEEMAQFATLKRFQVYVAEIEESVDVCAKRNIHKRTKEEIAKIGRVWEKTPSQFIKLDTRPLLQDEAIQDVEMEDVSDVEPDSEKPPTPAERGKIGPQVADLELEDIEDEDSSDNLLVSAVTSKWDTMEQSQEKLNKLDGLMKRRRSNNEDANVDEEPSIENWLRSNMPEDYVVRRVTAPGQKRVRWADIEERREQERMREVGFVVGQTDWKRMMDPTFGSSALTRTKFI